MFISSWIKELFFFLIKIIFMYAEFANKGCNKFLQLFLPRRMICLNTHTFCSSSVSMACKGWDIFLNFCFWCYRRQECRFIWFPRRINIKWTLAASAEIQTEFVNSFFPYWVHCAILNLIHTCTKDFYAHLYILYIATVIILKKIPLSIKMCPYTYIYAHTNANIHFHVHEKGSHWEKYDYKCIYLHFIFTKCQWITST